MGRREDNKADKRRRLIDAAVVVFGQVGVDAATIDAIVLHAGVARGTFYLYFADKLAVFDAILDQWDEPVVGLLTDVSTSLLQATTFEEVRVIWEGMAVGLAVVGLAESAALTLAFRELRGSGPAAALVAKREARIVDLVVAFTTDVSARGLVRIEEPRIAALIVIGATERLVWEGLNGRITSPATAAATAVALFATAFAIR